MEHVYGLLPKQIRKMGKNKKVKKKDVGSANDRAARGEAADGSGAEFALGGMGLGPLSAGAAGASGEEITSAEPTGPPACSMLDDVASQPAEVDPSPGGCRRGWSPPRQDSPSNSRVLLLGTRFARLRGSWRQRRCRTRATRGVRVGRFSPLLLRQAQVQSCAQDWGSGTGCLTRHTSPLPGMLRS